MKKQFSIALLFVGIVFICLPVLLAIVATANKDIIGGADWPTFCFVFFSENSGLYASVAFFGVLFVVASALLCIIKKNG